MVTEYITASPLANAFPAGTAHFTAGCGRGPARRRLQRPTYRRSPTMMIAGLRLQLFVRQLAEELERFIELAYRRASNPAATIQLVQEHQIIVILRCLNPRASLDAERTESQRLRLHVVGDKPLCAFGNGAFQSLQRGRDVVGRVDGLANVVQQGGQQKFLVVWPLVARQFEDLQAVVKDISFRMVLRALLDPLHRLQEHPKKHVRVEPIFQPLDLGFQVDVGIPAHRISSSSAIDARSIALPVIELLKT